jgi:hypothetical protein
MGYLGNKQAKSNAYNYKVYQRALGLFVQNRAKEQSSSSMMAQFSDNEF